MKQFLTILFLLMPLVAMADLNVTNYGASGDLIILTNIATISGSPTVTCLGANFQTTDVNKTILVQDAGIIRGSTNESLLALITGRTSATVITIDRNAGVTSSGMTGNYYTNNYYAFSNCLRDAKWAGVTNIIIPISTAGSNYGLCDPNMLAGTLGAYSAETDILLDKRGGLNFMGTGPIGSITLTANGGWKQIAGGCERGTLFNVVGGLTNDFGLTWSNLVMDGGLGKYPGNIDPTGSGGQGFPANSNTGYGIDITHDAIVHFGDGNGTGVNVATNILINCGFQHWRGEMVKNNSSQPYIQLFITNCWAMDGNLTWLNNYGMTLVNSICTNSWQVGEFYVTNPTNPTVVVNNIFSNCFRGFAFSGNVATKYTAPLLFATNIYSIYNYVDLFSPAGNITKHDNTYVGQIPDSLTVETFSGAGYQGDGVPTNMQFYGEHYINCNVFNLSLNVVGSFSISNCVGTITDGHHYLFESVSASASGSMSNLVMSGNITSGGIFYLDASGQTNGYYPLDLVNNIFSISPFGGDSATAGQTNDISYALGRFHQIVSSTTTSGFYCQEIPLNPPGAILQVQNTSGVGTLVYLSSAKIGSPVAVANGATQTFYWFSPNWSTNSFPTTFGNGPFMWRAF